MIDDDLKYIILFTLLASVVIAVYPIAEERRIIEPYSELGVLGPGGLFEDYPSDLAVDEEFDLSLYIGNHEGVSGYYRVLAKLVEPETNSSDISPFEGVLVRSWETVLVKESNTTIPIKLSLSESGINRRLVFELWRYDVSLQEFVYQRSWTQLWFNVTSPG